MSNSRYWHAAATSLAVGGKAGAAGGAMPGKAAAGGTKAAAIHKLDRDKKRTSEIESEPLREIEMSTG